MYSNGCGDARSGLTRRLRDPSSVDHSPSDMWERQAFPRDKFDCADRDKYGPAKRVWAMDARASSTRSSSSLFSNVGSSGSSKRRDPGRHGSTHELNRYGGGACKPLDVPSLVRSPPENSKAERDLFSSSGGPSPGYSSSLSMEKPGKEADGIHLRGSHFSPPAIRPASSPCFDRSPGFDPPLRDYAMQNTREGPLWEHDRSKFNSSPSVRNMSYRDKDKFGGRPEYHRRTYSLPKLQSSKDWNAGDAELLEARVDRYGRSLTRELAFPDALRASDKQHYRNGWRTRDRRLLGGLSSHSPCSPSSNSKDIGAVPTQLEQPWSSSPPFQLAPQNSFSDQVNHDFGAGSTPPKKRPRLTWGQGLAKYEKEKIEEDHPEGLHAIVEFHKIVPASPDCRSRLTENSSFSPVHDQHREQDSCDSGNLSGCEFERAVTPKDLAINHCTRIHKHSLPEHLEDQSNENAKLLGLSISPREDLDFPTSVLQASILHEVQVFLSSFRRERPTLSKDVLTHHMEKVEQEIDRLEKELVKLDNGGEKVEQHSVCNISNLKIEVCGVESCDTSVSATETLLTHSEDLSVIGVASAENLPLIDINNAHMQLPEVAETTQSDRGRNHVPDGVSLPAIQPGEKVQYESGLLRPDVELTSIDKDLGLVESILVLNTHTAEMSLSSLAHLNSPKISAILECGRLYDSPQQSDVWTLNVESHSRKKKHLQAKVAEEKMSVNFVEKVLAVKFRAHKETRKQKQCGGQFGIQRGKRSNIMSVQHRDESKPIAQQSSLESWFNSVLKTEEVHSANLLKVSEDNRGFLRMPQMLLGRERELHNFEAKNGLVDDPISAEQERKFSNPWSKEEKNLFLENYSLFGKDFRRIASLLEHKTVADCVEFYYRNRKTQEFDKVHQKHRLQKHCRFQLEKHSVEQSGFYLSRFCEENTSCLDGLSLVAAVAAAMSAPTTKPTYCGLATPACIKVSSTQFSVKGLRHSECNGAHSRARASYDTEWTDNETKLFLNAVLMFGKDFDSIARNVGTRNELQCQSYFRKVRRHLCLDELVKHHQAILQTSRANIVVSEKNIILLVQK